MPVATRFPRRGAGDSLRRGSLDTKSEGDPSRGGGRLRERCKGGTPVLRGTSPTGGPLGGGSFIEGEGKMNIFYIIGVIVVVLVILSFLGLR